jgi:transcriptional regulator with XRE-family HTH domain
MTEETFAELLKRLRYERKLTQAKMAEAVGLELRNYQAYEYGERLDPGLTIIKGIISGLKLEPGEILGDPRKERPSLSKTLLEITCHDNWRQSCTYLNEISLKDFRRFTVFRFLAVGLLFASQVAIAQTVTPTPVPAPSVIVPEPTPKPTEIKPNEKSSNRRFSLGAYYSLGSTLNMSNIVVTQGSASGTVNGNFGTGTAFGLSAEMDDFKENSIGWLGGFSYEFNRSVNSFTASGAGGTATATFPTPPSVSFFILYAGAEYKWTNLYIPFGINFNIPNFQVNGSTPGTTASTNFNGGLGAQVGLGYMLSDNFSAEFQLQYLTFTGSLSSTTGSTTIVENFNTITFLDPIFKLKYTF